MAIILDSTNTEYFYHHRVLLGFFIIIICIGQHSYTEQFSKDVKAMKDTERQGTAPD